MTEAKRAADLALQPGDVIRCEKSNVAWWTVGREYTVSAGGQLADDDRETWGRGGKRSWYPKIPTFSIVSRAAVTHTKLKDMTDAEYVALRRWHDGGGEVQLWDGKHWVEAINPAWSPSRGYRIKPAEPVVSEVERKVWLGGDHYAWTTYTLRDGVPDPVAKVEPAGEISINPIGDDK
ncbi:MAG: hypothetical protein KJP02_04555 [Octadecabacter sp.]|nr:hypothetical protein [Octadecabacter sp.]